jgi:DNA mismatch endonuclease (patch repair protein)
MKAQARSDTKPEVALRSALSKHGLRYRKNVKPIKGLRREVDVHFGVAKVAIFVDGCFWHGCPEHSRPTKSNTKWWADKIARNRERDAETTDRLEEEGYEVIRVWEHEQPEVAAKQIAEVVKQRRR